MTGAQVAVASTVVMTLLGVVSFVIGVRRAAQRQAHDDAGRLTKIRADAIEEGKRLRDDEVALIRSRCDADVALLRSQLDDARRDRDRAAARADEWERRWVNLRDRRNGQ